MLKKIKIFSVLLLLGYQSMPHAMSYQTFLEIIYNVVAKHKLPEELLNKNKTFLKNYFDSNKIESRGFPEDVQSHFIGWCSNQNSLEYSIMWKDHAHQSSSSPRERMLDLAKQSNISAMQPLTIDIPESWYRAENIGRLN
jgi:hypothetical protein